MWTILTDYLYFSGLFFFFAIFFLFGSFYLRIHIFDIEMFIVFRKLTWYMGSKLSYTIVAKTFALFVLNYYLNC